MIDYSANPPAFPASGYVLLATIPAAIPAGLCEVQNQSSSQLQLVLDDGNGSVPTVIVVDPGGGGAGGQGGSYDFTGFSGRVRIYGPAGAQFAAFRN